MTELLHKLKNFWIEYPTKCLYYIGCVSGVLLVLVLLITLVGSETPEDIIAVEAQMPEGYSPDYFEDPKAYEELEEFKQIDWETFEADPTEKFTTVNISSDFADCHVPSSKISLSYLTASDTELIMLPEDEAWVAISNGIYQEYPQGNFLSNKTKLYRIRNTYTKTITVKCWYWEDPSADTNFNKITTTRTFAVNRGIAQLFEHAFEDIYNHPSKPVINIADRGMGTWVIRGKNHNDYARMSTHALGCCIDINPSTGSFYVNKKWYGNGYKQNPMPKKLWEQLPECHKKYHVLYDGSPIVNIFKSYGFVWGGDWKSTPDPMHLSWIGEGSDTRKQGQKNYKELQN